MGILADLTPPEKQKRCPFGRTIDALEKEDRAVLEAALADERWTHRALFDALRQRGITVSRETLTRHRTKACQC
jgi:hypothetical protein